MEITYEYISGTTNAVLRGRLVYDDSLPVPLPAVIMLTGDGPKGTKSLSWVNMPPRLMEVGVASFLFDFEGLGYSDGIRRQLSLTKGMDNLRSTFVFISQLDLVDKSRLGFLGSSFGATALLLQPDIANKAKLIGLKSPASFLADAYINEIRDAGLDRWLIEGYLDDNGYDIEVLLDCLRHNAFESAMNVTSPCLITHGDADEIVPVRQSKMLAACLAGKTRLEVFPKCDHGYSVDGAWERMATMFVSWFKDL